MPLTRRNVLRGLSVAALSGPALPQLTEAFFQAAALPAPHEDFILLSRNENPYGPFPSVQQAMRDALGRANRYVFQPDYQNLVERIARLHGVGSESVIVGMGSTELLRMAADAFTGLGKVLITGNPTFEAMGGYARRVGAQVMPIALTSSYAHDLEAMLKAAQGAASGGLIYLCNPNNPTGSITPASNIKQFLGQIPRHFVVLIDEAYHHFAVGMAGYAPAELGPNLIITRTFSKVFALAGIRLGYGIAAPELVEQMRPAQLDNDINRVAASAGSVALDDISAIQTAATRTISDRQEFMRQAEQRKLQVIPSYTNFALMNAGQPAARLRLQFREQKIEIGRPFPPMTNHIRVSFGTPDQMRKFWKAWDQIHG